MWFDVVNALATLERGEVPGPCPASAKRCVAEVATVAASQVEISEFEERAAICEFDGGLPREHAEALAALHDPALAVEAGLSEVEWQNVINLASVRLDRLSHQNRRR
jgi:hypothetical protein